MTVFDLDDTIFDHSRSHTRGLSAARAELGVAPTAAGMFANGFEVSVRQTAPRVLRGMMTPAEALRERLRSAAATTGAQLSRRRTSAAVATYRTAYEGSARAQRGALTAVRAARAYGPVVLLSNGFAPAQRRKLEWCGLSSMFDAELYSSDLGMVKPNQQVFGACERLFGLKSRHACMIGDSFDHDIVPAARRGWNTAWIGKTTLQSVPAMLERWCASA